MAKAPEAVAVSLTVVHRVVQDFYFLGGAEEAAEVLILPLAVVRCVMPSFTSRLRQQRQRRWHLCPLRGQRGRWMPQMCLLLWCDEQYGRPTPEQGVVTVFCTFGSILTFLTVFDGFWLVHRVVERFKTLHVDKKS